MFSTRRTLAVTALCAVTLLTGCSSDGSDGDAPDADGSPTPSQTLSTEMPGEPCEADVQITGKSEAAWTGVANVITNGGTATYGAAEGETNVLVQSGTKKTPATLVVAISGDVLNGEPGAEGVEADPKGGGAEVDADVTGKVQGKPTTLHVAATFDC